MRFGQGRRFAAACVVAGVAGLATLATSLPADGVQTTKFGLAATGARSKIVHAATGGRITDGVLVYNRTNASLPISLDVVGVTRKPDGSYALGAAGQGLAARIHLQARSVTLGPKERRTVTLTIDAPGSLRTAEYAAVTAVAGPASSPGLSVTERLAVLVGLTPPGAGSSSASHASHTRTVAVVVATVLLMALIALLVSWFSLRRRRAGSAAAGTP